MNQPLWITIGFLAWRRARRRKFEATSRAAGLRRLQGMNTRHAVIDGLLGELTLVADEDSLIGVYFRHHWYRPPIATFGPRVNADDDSLLTQAQAQLDEFLVGERSRFDLPTTARGDHLHRRIWDRLTAIPYGETVTYGELAVELANGTTAQQVGTAVGRNPLSIVVPCHRVVGKDGKLTGYAGGLERKKFLLDLEEPADIRAARLF
jgi:methylated-DNA-[protein]-cysteine S-methyltransferase